MKYRKRPVVVEARQVPDEPDGEFELWLGDAFESWLPSRQAIAFHVKKNGNREAVAHAGDWIIEEPDGDGFYPSVSTVTGDLTLPTKENP